MKNLWIKSIVVGAGIVVITGTIFFILPGKTIAEALPCAINKCPKEITIADNGNTFVYGVDRRFSVILDRFIYPPDDLNCSGDQIIQKTLSLRDSYPNQMQRFVVKEPGSCLLNLNDFSVTIVAINSK